MIKKIGLTGLKHMGCEHYMSMLELASRGSIVIQALCDCDPGALKLPKPAPSIAEANLLLANSNMLGNIPRLELLHKKMQLVCEKTPAMYTDYKEMLDQGDLDGVIVATPNHLHREMAEYALSKDIAVLCEKPLATTVEDCLAMIQAEKKSRAFLQVGLHMRYRRMNRIIRDLIAAGTLGELKMMWCQEFRGDWYEHGYQVENHDGTPTNWRFMDKTSGGSIGEKLCHDFDVFAWWCGARPVRVGAMGGKGVFKDRETIDHANILVEYENGVNLNVSLCMFSPNHRFDGRYMGLIGDRASLDFDNSGSSFVIYYSSGEKEEHKNVEGKTIAGYHAGNASLLQMQEFVDSIETGSAPFANAQIALDSVLVSKAAERSIREGVVISL